MQSHMIVMKKAIVLVFIALSHVRAARPNVVFGFEDEANNPVKNWDFEYSPSSSDWQVKDAEAINVTGGYNGGSCFRITQRTRENGCVKQQVKTGLKTNTNYYLSVFTKQLNDDTATKAYARFRLYVKMRLLSGKTETVEVGRLPFQRKDNVWKQLGGDFKTPKDPLSYIEISLTVDPVKVNYLIDKASLIVLEKPSDWKAHLDTKIDTHRRSDVQLKAIFPSGYDLANTKIKVRLIRHKFGFGTAIKALLFTRTTTTNMAYRNFILDNFNWAVFENDMKWRQMQPTEGANRIGKIDQSLDILEAHNMTVRGHTVQWDIKEVNPAWVQEKQGQDLLDTVNKRTNDVIKHFKGRIHEWDIVNEILHQHYLEDVTKKYDVLGDTLKRVHKIDNKTLLFLNDYELVRSGMLTSAQVDLARSMKAQGYPVDGIGIQSHLRTLPMDVELMENRVKIAAAADMPVSITELSLHSKDEQVKADGADMAYRVYFAEPGITDIMMWGFSDQPGYSFIDDMYLTIGPTFQPNKAGKVILDLIRKEWNTTKQFVPDVAKYSEQFRAIHGTYQVDIVTDGQIRKSQQFYVDNVGTNLMKIKV